MSTHKTKAAEQVGVGKRTKADISPCDIKTWKQFQDNYAGHTIYKKKHSFLCSSSWNTPEGKAEIAAWLKVVAGEQVRMYERIKRNSEAALYPLIITALLPVFDLCDCTATGNIEQIAGDIAKSQSRKISRQISAEKAGPSVPSTAAPAADVSELPKTIHTANEAEVMRFMVYIEKWLSSSEYTTKGRVEILISNETTGDIVAVIEAKPHISNSEPDDAGFYQCCAYMALQNIPFGIFTDHKAFQFVRMDGSKVLHHSRLYDLMKSEYDCLDQDATEVYAHLFEIMGVPSSTNLLTKATESAATWAQRAAVLTARLV